MARSLWIGALGQRRVASALGLRLLLLLVPLLGMGCATPQSFVPVAGVRAAAPDGVHSAADYQLDQAARGGHVRVWSRGAFRDDSEGEAVTVVHIGFSVQNQGTLPLRLDERRIFLEDVASSEGTIQQLAPAQIKGNVAVAPSSTGSVDAYFTLPRRIWPSDIFGYRVAWALEGEQARVEHTAFESTRYRAYAGYYYPYYPWGWYYPWRPYPYGPYPPYSPYPYWGGYPYWGAYPYRGGAAYPSRMYVAPRVYAPRVLARPRAR